MPKVRKKRMYKATALACDNCQARKVRCEAASVGAQCQGCITRGRVCTYRNPSHRTKKMSPELSINISEVFSLRQSSLLSGEKELLEKVFRVVDLPELHTIRNALPTLVLRTSLVEFRLMIHTLFATLYFCSEYSLSQPRAPSPESIHHYAAAVELLPKLGAGNPIMAPIFSLLDTIKYWAELLFEKS